MALDPKTNRAEREAEKIREAMIIPPLEPPFPFVRESFDPLRFELDRETIEEEAARAQSGTK